MLITGKPNNGYRITNDKSICKVLNLQGLDKEIYVEVMYSPDEKQIGSKWAIDHKRMVKYVGPFVQPFIPEDKKDEIRDFQVGDYVIGNSRNPYTVTRKGQICKVKYVYNKDKIQVYLVTLKPYRESCSIYTVEKKYFDLYKRYRGLFVKTSLNGTIKVVDNKPVLPVQINTESPCYEQIVKELVDNGLIKKGE